MGGPAAAPSPGALPSFCTPSSKPPACPVTHIVASSLKPPHLEETGPGRSVARWGGQGCVSRGVPLALQQLPPQQSHRTSPGDTGCPDPSPAPTFIPHPHQGPLALQAAGRSGHCSWGLVYPRGRPWMPPVARPPVHLPSCGHTPDRAPLKIARCSRASAEPPFGA